MKMRQTRKEFIQYAGICSFITGLDSAPERALIEQAKRYPLLIVKEYATFHINQICFQK